MLTAKLLVAAGAPLQLKAGERLPPVQPKPLNTCSLAILAPGLISELVKLNPAAFAPFTPSALTPSAAIHIPNLLMAFLPFDQSDFYRVPPVSAIALWG
jgi:hypothetical protein